MKAGRHFGQSKRHTFNELADEYQPYAKDVARLGYWRDVFGSDSLDSITAARIAKARDKLLSEETHNFAAPATGDPKKDARRPKAKRRGSTVNRYIAALSVCLSYGVKTLQWLERNPASASRSHQRCGPGRGPSAEVRRPGHAVVRKLFTTYPVAAGDSIR